MSRTAEHLAVDPNVRIPRGVKRAVARAEKIHQEAYRPAEEPKPDANEAAPSKSEETITIVEAAPDTKPAEPKPEVKPEPTPAPAAPEVTTASNSEETNWKHRYESMKGRYDQSQLQMRQMSERLNQMQEMLANLQRQPAPAPAAAPEVDPIITPEEEETYGSEFLKVVEKVAKKAVKPLKQELDTVQERVKGVDSQVSQDARARMFNYMDANLPNWADINVDDRFKTWLGLPDTYSGAIRFELLRQAYERNDGPRVLAFFKGFLAEEAASAPAVVLSEPQAQPAPAKVPLVELAAPGRAKSPAASTPAPVEKPIITSAQITRFYADVRAGKYAGKEAEKERLERMIFEAQGDGRIR